MIRPLDLDGRPVSPGLYWWVRDLDETGMSGAGRVAQVAVFEDGSAVLRWLAARNTAGVGSSAFYDQLRDLIYVHGHGDKRTGRLERVATDDGRPDDVCTMCGRTRIWHETERPRHTFTQSPVYGAQVSS